MQERLLTQRPAPYHQRPGGLDVCAYCGAVLDGRDDAEAHIRACPSHPLAAMRIALESLLEVAERDRAGYPVESEVWYAARDSARAALEG